LISYVTYHSQAPQSNFGGVGWIRPTYFFILITHIALAPILIPFVLLTLSRGAHGELVKHRRLARWTLPMWMYTSVTGVLVYLMMAPYYAS
jgi:putative membrane protein